MKKKYSNYLILVLGLIIFLGIGTALYEGSFFPQENKSSTLVTSKRAISLFAQAAPPLSHKRNKQLPAALAPIIASKEPSPLDYPSKDELKEFPGASVIQFEETDGPEVGQKTRTRILQTNFKYPYIRTEEIIDTASGALIVRGKMVADHFLVTLSENEDPDRFLEAFGPGATAITRVTPDAPLYQVQLENHTVDALPSALAHIKEQYLSSAQGEPDIICRASDTDSTGIPIASDQLYPYNDDQWALRKIKAPQAWLLQHSAKEVVVAVIDSGIRYTHEDLKHNIWKNPNINTTINDLYGYNAVEKNGDPMDDCGHGTHCAGIIGGNRKGLLHVAGVADNVQLMACKFMNSSGAGTMADVIACLDYACDHGASILNASFGSDFQFGDGVIGIITPYSFPDLATYSAIKRARNKGVIFVVAAGNDGINSDSFPQYPASYCLDSKYTDYDEKGNPVEHVLPALDNVVPVAATNSDDKLCSFSNYGTKSVFLAAPGENIFSTYHYSDHAYTFMSGTSMATPYVVGALALMKAKNPNIAYNTLIKNLLESTDPMKRVLPDNSTLSLSNLLNGQPQTKSGGRLNVEKALTRTFHTEEKNKLE